MLEKYEHRLRDLEGRVSNLEKGLHRRADVSFDRVSDLLRELEGKLAELEETGDRTLEVRSLAADVGLDIEEVGNASITVTLERREPPSAKSDQQEQPSATST